MNASVESSQKAPQVSVTITVNGHDVNFGERKVTGADIKRTAIAQGVPIQQDFALFAVKGGGHLKPIPDEEVVELHDKEAFRAVAPDDNS